MARRRRRDPGHLRRLSCAEPPRELADRPADCQPRPTRTGRGSGAALMTYVRRFFAFWYDFLIGDKIELFVGPLAAMLIVGIGVGMGLDSTIAGFLFFGLIVLVGGFSLWRSVRSVGAG